VQEVAAASREQKAGVDQINRAMSRVDEVTQRNAAGAEEMASTAEELASQAETQQRLTAYFQLEPGSGDRAHVSPQPALPVPVPATAAGPRRLPRPVRAPDPVGTGDGDFRRF
jgi:methyl-accepting chemotaxis protein